MIVDSTLPWTLIPALVGFGVAFIVQFRLKKYVDREKVIALEDLSELYPNSIPPRKVLNERGRRLYLWLYAGTAAFIGFLLLTVLLHREHFPSDRGAGVESEMQAMATAFESYKVDNGRYPTDPSTTELLRPGSTFDPELYIPASQFLYKALSGDPDGDPSTNNTDGTRVYFNFKPEMLKPAGGGPGTYIVDPWGNSYGYSTFRAAHPERQGGYNLLYDLWSTGGGKTDQDKRGWFTNW